MKYLPYAFRTASRLLSPEELYDHYGHALTAQWEELKESEKEYHFKQLKSAIEEMMVEQFTTFKRQYGKLSNEEAVELRFTMPFQQLWDERWLDWAIDQEWIYFASYMARPNDERCRVFFADIALSEGYEKDLSYVLIGLRRADMASEFTP